MADRETPVDIVLSMMHSGSSDPEIIRRLSEQGYSPVQITDALNQAKIKKEINVTEGLQPSIMQSQAPALQLPVPTPYGTPVPRPTAAVPQQQVQISTPVSVTAEYPTYPYQYPTAEQESPKFETEAMEEIAEEIVNEKWAEIKNKISDVVEWKIYAEKRVASIDERIKRIEQSMDRLQAALLTKVQEYQRSVKDLGVEMASIEGAFGKVLTPFVDNMRELSRITGELKSTQNRAKPKAKKARAKTVTTTDTVVNKPSAKKPQSKVVKKVTVTKTVKK
jgi:hypothetical protein